MWRFVTFCLLCHDIFKQFKIPWYLKAILKCPKENNSWLFHEVGTVCKTTFPTETTWLTTVYHTLVFRVVNEKPTGCTLDTCIYLLHFASLLQARFAKTADFTNLSLWAAHTGVLFRFMHRAEVHASLGRTITRLCTGQVRITLGITQPHLPH